jgi:hypothetical protein
MPFEADGRQFGRGTLIILKNGNEKFADRLWNMVGRICDSMGVVMTPVNSGMVDKGFDFGSSRVHYIKPPRVAMFTGEGVGSNAAGEVWFFFDRELNYPVSLFNVNDFARIDWSKIDVLVMPDGNYRFLDDKSSAAQFGQWIRNGGRVVALENAVLQLSKQEWSSVKLKKDEDKDTASKKDPYRVLRVFENRERDGLQTVTPGSIYKTDIDSTHPLMYGYPNFYYTLKMDTNVYEFIRESGWNTGVIKKTNQVAGFVGHKLKDKLKDGLVFGVQQMGRGSITYLSDNPLFRNFWENGKLMFCNAVFLVGQ